MILLPRPTYSDGRQARSQEELLLGLQDRLRRLPARTRTLTQHIQDNAHRQQLRANKFSKHILETEQRFRLLARAPEPLVEPLLETKLLDETNEPEKTAKHLAIQVD